MDTIRYSDLTGLPKIDEGEKTPPLTSVYIITLRRKNHSCPKYNDLLVVGENSRMKWRKIISENRDVIWFKDLNDTDLSIDAPCAGVIRIFSCRLIEVEYLSSSLYLKMGEGK